MRPDRVEQLARLVGEDDRRCASRAPPANAGAGRRPGAGARPASRRGDVLVGGLCLAVTAQDHSRTQSIRPGPGAALGRRPALHRQGHPEVLQAFKVRKHVARLEHEPERRGQSTACSRPGPSPRGDRGSRTPAEPVDRTEPPLDPGALPEQAQQGEQRQLARPTGRRGDRLARGTSAEIPSARAGPRPDSVPRPSIRRPGEPGRQGSCPSA